MTRQDESSKQGSCRQQSAFSLVYLFPAKNEKTMQSREALSRSHGEDSWPMASMAISAITNAAVMPAPAFEQFRP